MKSILLIPICCLLAVEAFIFPTSKNYKLSSVNKSSSYSGRDTEWWKTGVFYQIYPRSFKDLNNKGNGTLPGIISKLPYLKDLGITGVWISPIYPSPQVDQGYDISDYRDVDPMFGTLADLRSLIDQAHAMGIKVILDYVPNHTSHMHKWFQASLKNDTKYGNYYIWKDAKYVNGTKQPPNNWLSCFGGSAWEWNEDRQQYYLHQFSWGQPDLNYRNPDVVEEMKDVLRYWLEFGADGFRMDAVPTLFEDPFFRDEPLSGFSEDDPEDYYYLNHTYTSDLDDTFEMIYQWREVLDEFNEKNGSYDRIMMTEAYSSINKTFYFYGTPNGDKLGAHFTFNFLSFVRGLTKGFNATDVAEKIAVWLYNIPAIYESNWVLGNHDNNRVASRLGVEYVDALNMLLALLPGVQITYMGEEIGMEDGEVTCEQGWDPQAITNCSTFAQKSRDFERTPYQWDNTTNAGFNQGAEPWLPVSKKYLQTNLASQNVPELNTHHNIYKDMLKVRADIGKKQEFFDIMVIPEQDVVYISTESQKENLFCAMLWNIGNETVTVPFFVDQNMSLTGTVVAANVYSNLTKNDTFLISSSTALDLGPYEAVVFFVDLN